MISRINIIIDKDSFAVIFKSLNGAVFSMTDFFRDGLDLKIRIEAMAKSANKYFLKYPWKMGATR